MGRGDGRVCVCVRVCACVCVHACACLCVRACVETCFGEQGIPNRRQPRHTAPAWKHGASEAGRGLVYPFPAGSGPSGAGAACSSRPRRRGENRRFAALQKSATLAWSAFRAFPSFCADSTPSQCAASGFAWSSGKGDARSGRPLAKAPATLRNEPARGPAAAAPPPGSSPAGPRERTHACTLRHAQKERMNKRHTPGHRRPRRPREHKGPERARLRLWSENRRPGLTV